MFEEVEFDEIADDDGVVSGREEVDEERSDEEGDDKENGEYDTNVFDILFEFGVGAVDESTEVGGEKTDSTSAKKRVKEAEEGNGLVFVQILLGEEEVAPGGKKEVLGSHVSDGHVVFANGVEEVFIADTAAVALGVDAFLEFVGSFSSEAPLEGPEDELNDERREEDDGPSDGARVMAERVAENVEVVEFSFEVVVYGDS